MRRTSMFLLALGMLGALSGYLRELALANAYGAGALTDAYFVAISIPMVLGDLLLGSILTTCVVPVFSQLRERPDGARDAAAVLNAMLLVILVMGLAIAMLVSLFMPAVIALLAPGFNEAGRSLLSHYAYWLVWLLPVNAALLLSNLVLNAHRVFLQPAITWTAVNLLFFGVIVFGKDSLGRDALLWAALSGPLLLLVLNLWRLRKEGLLLRETPGFRSAPFRTAFLLARPVLLTFGIGSGLGLLMVSHVILRAYGSDFGDGAISALGYAFRIYEVPITLITSSAGVLVLPVFATLFHQQDREELVRVGRNVISWGLLLLIPAAVAVYMLAEPLVALLFHSGAFKASDVALTAEALRGFAPAILFETAFMIIFRMFYGMHRPGFTVVIGLSSVAVLYLFLEYMGTSSTVAGLALSLSLTFGVAALLCFAGLRYLLGKSVLPGRRELAILCGMVLAGLALSGGSGNLSDLGKVVATTGFGLVCAGLVWVFLPDKAADVRRSIKSIYLRFSRGRSE